MAIPSTIRAGTSIDWSFILAEYLPSDGWSARIHLTSHSGGAAIAIPASANSANNGFVVQQAADYTDAWAAGSYTLDIEVTKGTDIFVPCTQPLTVQLKLGTTSDKLTALQADLAAVDAARKAIAAGEGIAEMEIDTMTGKRRLQFMSIRELLALRRWIISELATCRRKLGLTTVNKSKWRPIRMHLK